MEFAGSNVLDTMNMTANIFDPLQLDFEIPDLDYSNGFTNNSPLSSCPMSFNLQAVPVSSHDVHKPLQSLQPPTKRSRRDVTNMFVCKCCLSSKNKPHREDNWCWSCYRYAHSTEQFPSLWPKVAAELVRLLIPTEADKDPIHVCKDHRGEVLGWLKQPMHRSQLEVAVPELSHKKYKKILPILVEYATGTQKQRITLRRSGPEISKPQSDMSNLESLLPTWPFTSQDPISQLTDQFDADVTPVSSKSDSEKAGCPWFGKEKLSKDGREAVSCKRTRVGLLKVSIEGFVKTENTEIDMVYRQWFSKLLEKYYPSALPQFQLADNEVISSHQIDGDRVSVSLAVELDDTIDPRKAKDRGMAFKDLFYTLKNVMSREHGITWDVQLLPDCTLSSKVDLEIHGDELPSHTHASLWLCLFCKHFRVRKNHMGVCQSCYKQVTKHFPRVWPTILQELVVSTSNSIRPEDRNVDNVPGECPRVAQVRQVWNRFTMSQKKAVTNELIKKLSLTTKQQEILLSLIGYSLSNPVSRAKKLKPQPFQHSYGRREQLLQ